MLLLELGLPFIANHFYGPNQRAAQLLRDNNIIYKALLRSRKGA